MPLYFLTDSAESFATEEVNQECFGHVIRAFSEEMRHTIFTAPLIDSFSVVASEGCNFVCRQ